jgi:hypothetical protein
MDEYGFAAALKLSLRMFEMLNRGTGRTMRLVERVTEEDQIVVASTREAEALRYHLKRAGKPKIRVLVYPPQNFGGFGPQADGRTFFDHNWTLKFFEHRLRSSEQDLENLQRAVSKTWPEKPEIDSSATRIHIFERDLA